MSIKEQILADKEKIEKARESYTAARMEFDAVRNPITKQHQDLLDKFQRIINDQIERDHKCDCCYPKYYDVAWFVDDGVVMRIDAEDPNDIIDSKWTWEEFEKVVMH